MMYREYPLSTESRYNDSILTTTKKMRNKKGTHADMYRKTRNSGPGSRSVSYTHLTLPTKA